MIQFARLIRDAIFAPSRFLLLLNRERRAVFAASLAALLWTSAGVALTASAMAAALPINSRAIAAGVLMAPFLSWMLGGFGLIISGSGAVRGDRLDGMRLVANESVSIGAGLAFWMLRSQITFTPIVTFFTVFVVNENLQGRLTAPAVDTAATIALCIGFGMALATIITVTMARAPGAPQARRILAAGLAFMILEAMALAATADGQLLVLFLLGGLIGTLRPISWLWQSIASLAFAALARRARRPPHWWRAHPAIFDELALLGLPGLATFLARLYACDAGSGIVALVTVHQQAGQQRAVRRAIRRLASHEALAARFFFDLSTQPAGVALLRQLSERLLPVHPLIEPYAAFGAVSDPQAWPSAIGDALPLLRPHAGKAGFAAQLAVLQASQRVLQAHEWGEAAAALAAAGPEDADSPLWRAYAGLRAAALALHADPAPAPGSGLDAEGAELEGWPSHLMASVGEQLAYLHQRMASPCRQESYEI